MRPNYQGEPGAKPGRVLACEFFNRDPQLVGPDLLGKLLVRREGNQFVTGRIVEVEAYLGENDPAAHSSAGRTLRNAVLFGPPGLAYVYFIYGNHFCLNVSCLPDGQAGGILFRALEPLSGIDRMAQARGVRLPPSGDLRRLTSGPGRLAAALGVTRARDNGKDLSDPSSDLFLAEPGDRSPRPPILITARIGITHARLLPLRYLISGNQFVSRAKPARETSAKPG